MALEYDEDYYNWNEGDTIIWSQDVGKENPDKYIIDHIDRVNSYIYWRVPVNKYNGGFNMTRGYNLMRIKKGAVSRLGGL